MGKEEKDKKKGKKKDGGSKRGSKREKEARSTMTTMTTAEKGAGKGHGEFSTKGLEDFRRAGLEAHNEARRRHGVEDLKMNPKLCIIAQRWAERMAEEGKLHHSRQEPKWRLGENIYSHKHSGGPEEEAERSVANFAAEMEHYSFAAHGPKSSEKVIGHFTQLVWRRSAELGLGYALAARKNTTFVCYVYDPPGNLEGDYEDNVYPPGSRAIMKPPLSLLPTLVLNRHNHYRTLHGMPTLSLDAGMNSLAQELADGLAAKQSFKLKLPADKPLGHLLAVAVNEWAPNRQVDKWYRDGKRNPDPQPGLKELHGWAQLCWRGTQRLGVGMAEGRPFSVLVLLYDPPAAPKDPVAFKENLPLPPALFVPLD